MEQRRTMRQLTKSTLKQQRPNGPWENHNTDSSDEARNRRVLPTYMARVPNVSGVGKPGKPRESYPPHVYTRDAGANRLDYQQANHENTLVWFTLKGGGEARMPGNSQNSGRITTWGRLAQLWRERLHPTRVGRHPDLTDLQSDFNIIIFHGLVNDATTRAYIHRRYPQDANPDFNQPDSDHDVFRLTKTQARDLFQHQNDIRMRLTARNRILEDSEGARKAQEDWMADMDATMPRPRPAAKPAAVAIPPPAPMTATTPVSPGNELDLTAFDSDPSDASSDRDPDNNFARIPPPSKPKPQPLPPPLPAFDPGRPDDVPPIVQRDADRRTPPGQRTPPEAVLVAGHSTDPVVPMDVDPPEPRVPDVPRDVLDARVGRQQIFRQIFDAHRRDGIFGRMQHVRPRPLSPTTTGTYGWDDVVRLTDEYNRARERDAQRMGVRFVPEPLPKPPPSTF